MTLVEPPSRIRGRPRNPEAEDAILDATMRILAEEGYSGLTTDKIAARAHASKSTIYRRWPSKEHMVVAALDRSPPLTPVDTGDLLGDLIAIVGEFVGLLRDTPLGGALAALAAERARNPSLAAAFDPFVLNRREPTRAVLRRAIARGRLPPAVDVEQAVDLIMGPVILRALFTPGDLRPDAVRALLEAVLRSLQATP